MRWRLPRLACLLLLAAAACSKGEADSILYVSVTAPATMPAASQLVVTLSGAVSDTLRFPESNTGTAIDFVPAATFVLVVPRAQSGSVLVAVDAVDAASQIVGHGEATATIDVGRRVDVAIALQLSPTDGGLPLPDGGNPPGDAPLDLGAGGSGGATGPRGTGGALTGGTVGQPGTGGVPGGGGAPATGGLSRAGGLPGTAGARGTGGLPGGTGGTTRDDGGRRDGGPDSGTDLPLLAGTCGDGRRDPGEICDCGNDPANLPSGCAATNGIYFGDGKGCSRACTQEPLCRDSSGANQACAPVCGDGHADPDEGCDDGNLLDGDGCSQLCQVENGFVCVPQAVPVDSPCLSGTGNCLKLPITYRDFQPENVAAGGHPDFPFLGHRFGGSTKPTTICVPNSSGPAKGNDSAVRCWGIVDLKLKNGKPQPGATTTCACQFSDWNVGHSSRIGGGYTANDSPLANGEGGFLGTAGTQVNTVSTAGAYSGTIVAFTSSSPGGPIWRGTVPAYKDATSFGQWWNDESTVNKSFRSVLELPSPGTTSYRFESQAHLRQGGFFPLDALNPGQATLCNLWPYWNRGNGTPIWTFGCQGDQYLYPPYVVASDCPNTSNLADGCWITGTTGIKHDFYFTWEARTLFAYESTGVELRLFSTHELWVFVNGVLVLDLGGIHSALPGKVTLQGTPGHAQIVEGGCLDAAGNIVGTTVGSGACSPAGVTKTAATPDDFRVRMALLGLTPGKVYELAIFGASRHPVDSDLQIQVSGLHAQRSTCTAR